MLKPYHLRLQSEIHESYRCQRAANSLDIDVEKKSLHEFRVVADVESSFNIGLIVGASGSGKTTLAKDIYGSGAFKEYLDPKLPVIEQFPKEMGYDECAEILSGVGLTSVPCWIRPAYTLSNGQKARAEAALAMFLSDSPVVIIDEWTSVVDRTVAKVMSHCIQKFARKNNKRVVLVSCHYDVADWLLPDWVIDCNKQEYIDHRGSVRQRSEELQFHIREVERDSWRYFSKYHYLSDRLPGGKLYLYGLFHGENQIGFQCFANYIPTRPGNNPIYHSNRTVIHPDYAGMGLGLKMINACCKIMRANNPKYELRATFSSIPLYKARLKDTTNWKLIKVETTVGKAKSQKMAKKDSYTFGRLKNDKSFRANVKTFSFTYIGN